jgi:hypothetical protein
MSQLPSNQSAAANRRPAGQLDGSGNLSAIVAADRAFPAAVAELGRWAHGLLPCLSLRWCRAMRALLKSPNTQCARHGDRHAGHVGRRVSGDTVKTTCTINLAVVIVIVFLYAMYCRWAGLPMDQRFLGLGPSWSGGLSSELSPSFLAVFAETMLASMFLCLRWAEQDMKPHRLLCAIVGIAGLWALFGTTLSHNVDQAVLDATPRWDRILGLYVWLSHLTYALTGPSDTWVKTLFSDFQE